MEFELILTNLLIEDEIFQPEVSAAIAKLKSQIKDDEEENNHNLIMLAFLNFQLGNYLHENEEELAIHIIEKLLKGDSSANIYVYNQELKAGNIYSFMSREPG